MKGVAGGASLIIQGSVNTELLEPAPQLPDPGHPSHRVDAGTPPGAYIGRRG
jgi:hypothetical protein